MRWAGSPLEPRVANRSDPRMHAGAGPRAVPRSRRPRSTRSGRVRIPRSPSHASIVPGTDAGRASDARAAARPAGDRGRPRRRASGPSGRRCTWSRCGGRGRRRARAGAAGRGREGRIDDAERPRRGAPPRAIRSSSGTSRFGLVIASSQRTSASLERRDQSPWCRAGRPRSPRAGPRGDRRAANLDVGATWRQSPASRRGARRTPRRRPPSRRRRSTAAAALERPECRPRTPPRSGSTRRA